MKIRSKSNNAHIINNYRLFILIGILLFSVATGLLIRGFVREDRLVVDVAVSEEAMLIVEGARAEVENKTWYRSGYYQGGYPPDDEGVCTDVVWRALKNANYNLKSRMAMDIRNNVGEYARVDKPDPNIDFRRVPNQMTYFLRNEESLTSEIIPGDMESVKEWQAGDIVIISKPQHVGIISDKRNNEGVPYVIHNMGPYPREEDVLFKWKNKIEGHFRIKDIN